MPKVAVKKKPTSSVSVADYITQQIAASGKSNVDIARAIGYERPNVVAMLKTGSFKLPLNKVGPLAQEIGANPVFMLRLVLNEYSPETWDVLSTILDDKVLTQNEKNLLTLMRKELHGLDIDLAAEPGFIAAAVPAVRELYAKRKANDDERLKLLKKSRSAAHGEQDEMHELVTKQAAGRHAAKH